MGAYSESRRTAISPMSTPRPKCTGSPETEPCISANSAALTATPYILPRRSKADSITPLNISSSQIPGSAPTKIS